MFEILLFLLVLGILVAVGLWAKKTFGCCCHECGSRMTSWGKLDREQQSEILSYFRSFEDRLPDTNRILVCGNCHTLYDDFSGESQSLDGDERSICKICNSPGVWYMGPLVNSGELPGFQKENRPFVDRVECLRCERNPSGDHSCVTCDTRVKVFGCRHCFTVYSWMCVHEGSFRFLVPLSDKAVLEKSIDANWGIQEI